MSMLLFSLWLIRLFIWVSAKCPVGTIEGNDSNFCYKIFGSPKNFFYAEEQCVSINGHLASIGDSFKNAFITKIAQDVLPEAQLWIGGNKQANNSWTWTDGNIFSYTNWAKAKFVRIPFHIGQPNGEKCTVIDDQNGQWYSIDCTTLGPYICEISAQPDNCPFSTVTQPTCPSQMPYCDSEWTYFNPSNSCYRVFLNASWSTAEANCMSYSGHLASIHSSDENLFIADLTKTGYIDQTCTTGEVWIGLSNNLGILNNTQFDWSDGTPFDYNGWAPYHPGQAGHPNICAAIASDPIPCAESDYQHWYDDPCIWVMRAYICKKPAYV